MNAKLKAMYIDHKATFFSIRVGPLYSHMAGLIQISILQAKKERRR